MPIIAFLAASVQPAPEPAIDPQQVSPIVVTTSREEEALPDAEPVTLLDDTTVEALAPARHTDLLRLFPSASLSETGSPGSQAQLRIRGAEANQTLLFVGGIKANDPAASNEARFELLGLPLGNALELVRGPRSALWGAEAIGGVVAVRPGIGTDGSRIRAEAGSDGFLRADAATRLGSFDLSAGYQRADGFDSFDGNGDKDGYSNLSAAVSGTIGLGAIDLELSAFGIEGTSEYDGFDPLTFLRADTRDVTDNRLGAARVGLAGDAGAGWSFEADASFLASSNDNRLDDVFLNRTSAERLATGAQALHEGRLGRFRSETILALRHETEWYRARDDQYGGATDQERQRGNTAAAIEWSLEGAAIRPELAVRHDIFTDFADATSVQIGLSGEAARQLTLFARYGTGIAQPSFTDLYGFFPGSFVGNPDLAPERSRGGEIGGLFGSRGGNHIALSLFDQTLTDEIVSTFDSTTFLSGAANSEIDSRRRGIEVEGHVRLASFLTAGANYSYLDASEGSVADAALDEVRRPDHRAALILTGERDDLTIGATLAYVGARFDTDFDRFPAETLRLDPYVLADARIAYRWTDALSLSLRGRNLFDTRYQDVIGYRTAGRGLYAGLDLRL
ncbi:TonB-dependent receptor [Sphingomicrobium sp. XHP0239]|uniref:TonB-dependent receptor plug domain-containing protein n=1 Tax=Sphingomicrobium maritimum TaxID=3133972 RepID=UPI0031CCD2EB